MPAPITIPPGFSRAEKRGRAALASGADLPWVTATLDSYQPPTTRSSTPSVADRSAMTTELLASDVHDHKDAIAALLATQMALTDPTATRQFVDQSLTHLAMQLQSVRVRAVYLVVTQPVLKQLVLDGWGSHSFHYNRVADKIIFDGEVDVTLTGAGAESLMPAIYKPEQSPAERAKALTDAIDRTESGVGSMIARQGKLLLQSTIGDFIISEALLPLHLDHDQDWFDAGVVGWLSSKAMGILLNDSSDDLIKSLSTPTRYNPVSFDSIDLAHPLSRDQLRPQLVAAYADTYRHRSVHVVADWLAASPADALPKTIAAIRQKKPADNAALLAIIRSETGIDLTAKLAPGG